MARAWTRLARTPGLSAAASAWLPSLMLACTAASAAGTARSSSMAERNDTGSPGAPSSSVAPISTSLARSTKRSIRW